MGGANNPEDDFRPPLPKEDRLWRHPSEVAAEERAAAVSVTTMRTSWKHALGMAAAGALGGALVVTGLFLTLAGSSPEVAQSEPIVSIVALDPVVPVARTVEPEEWVDVVITGVKPGLAQISVATDEGERIGSGVVIRSDGVILTSYDLLGDADQVDVLLTDDRSFEGSVLGRDRISGLAVVAIENADTPTAPLAIPKPRPDVGEYAVAVSALTNPTDLVRSSITGAAVNVPVRPDQDLHGLLQTDGSMPDHGSGGALVDDAGAVIGIVVGTGAENGTYAVPIGYARKIADDIIRYGQGMHSWMGIKGVDSVPEDGETTVRVGVRITSVIETSPADRAQLHKGDVITSIDDVEIVSMTELILELRKHPPDSDVEVRFLRDDQPFRVTLTVVGRHVGDTT